MGTNSPLGVDITKVPRLICKLGTCQPCIEAFSLKTLKVYIIIKIACIVV